MIKIILTSFSFLLTITLFGQNGRGVRVDSLNYDVISNNTNISYFGGGLNYDGTVNTTMFSLLSVGLNGVCFNEKFEINADSRLHITDRVLLSSVETPIRSKNKYLKSRDASLKFTYFIHNTINRKRKPIVVGTIGNSVYYMKIPVDVTYKIGIDAKIDAGIHYYYLNSFNDYRFSNGTSLNYDYRESSTTHRFINAGVGISFTNIERVTIKASRFGRSDFSELGKLSINVNFLVKSTLDDVLAEFEYYDPNSPISINGPELLYTYFEELSVDHIERSIIGLSIGYEKYMLRDLPHFGVGFEVGIKPGIKHEPYSLFFVDFKLKINVGKVIE